ncbi:hypothetical protein CA606_01015 [Caulobacter vibrioides]|uniref:DUF2059 domain-containing protein n=1 Tax=Caulobacter vibrioides TaxID=155892 RepID=A0A290MQ63_CAUVI|nr:hypothetical protein [Caulobacter vibrioides]ATC31043.1 hypothetical protein CA606_01015 [Caulobacter vibrioides]
MRVHRAILASIALMAATAAFAQTHAPSHNGSAISQAERDAFRAQPRDAGAEELMALIRQTYPEDYLGFESEMITARKTGATQSDLNQRAFQFGSDIRRRVEPYLKQAPTPDLLGFVRRQAEAIDQMRVVSPRACYESVEFGGLSADAARTLTPTIAKRLSLEGEHRLKVALKGKASPVTRAAPSSADREAAKAAFLRAGGDAGWLEALSHGAPRQQSDAVRCQSALAYLNGLLSLPADQAARLAAL